MVLSFNCVLWSRTLRGKTNSIWSIICKEGQQGNIFRAKGSSSQSICVACIHRMVAALSGSCWATLRPKQETSLNKQRWIKKKWYFITTTPRFPLHLIFTRQGTLHPALDPKPFLFLISIFLLLFWNILQWKIPVGNLLNVKHQTKLTVWTKRKAS